MAYLFDLSIYEFAHKCNFLLCLNVFILCVRLKSVSRKFDQFTNNVIKGFYQSYPVRCICHNKSRSFLDDRQLIDNKRTEPYFVGASDTLKYSPVPSLVRRSRITSSKPKGRAPRRPKTAIWLPLSSAARSRSRPFEMPTA